MLGVVACRPSEILSYDAETHAHSASGDPGNSVEGSYSYQTPEGDEVVVKYTADENGYVAISDALPVAPEVPEYDPPALPVAPEVPVAPMPVLPVAPVDHDAAKIAEIQKLHPHQAIPYTPLAIPALHHLPTVHHLGYSHFPYHPFAFPYLLSAKEE